ncbi:MAG: S8 family serine peptidase [Richelia sp. RM2_1_2]|nr:S8 family serine peptidase [Richelia sp. RM2_1_2]
MAKCIISLKDSNNKDEIKTKINIYNGTIVDELTAIPAMLIANVSKSLFDELKKDSRVNFIDWDETGSLAINQNITVGDNWGLDRIDQTTLPLNGKYTYVRNGFNADVYIFDSGLNYEHVDIAGRAFPLFDGVNDPQYPGGTDGNGHGTGVASLIGGAKYGVAKFCRFYSVKVANQKIAILSSDIISGANAVIIHHTNKLLSLDPRTSIANMSLGGFTTQSIDIAVNAMIDEGIVVVAAAGNNYTEASNYSPARIPNVLTVGAVDQLDQYATFSNYGEVVDIFAPGIDVLGAHPFDNSFSTITHASPYGNTLNVIPPGIRLRSIEIYVAEAFDDYPTLKIGYAANPVLVEISSSRLRTQDYQNTFNVNQVLNQTNETPIIGLFTKASASKGSIVIKLNIEKLSNSKSAELTGTSFAAPHVTGIVALKLEEESAPFSTQADVLSTIQFIIDVSTKDLIKNLPENTPNRLLYAPWSKANELEWVEFANGGIFVNEGQPISIVVEAIYYDGTGIPIPNSVYYAIPNSPTWGSTTTVKIDSNTGEITWAGAPPFVTKTDDKTFTIWATPIDSIPPKWQPSTAYQADTPAPGDTASVISYNEFIYRAVASHTSDLIFDPTKWQQVSTIENNETKSITYRIVVLAVENQVPEWVTPPQNELIARGNITQLPPATENVLYTPFNLFAIDPDTGLEVTSYVKISGSLPNGLTLNPITGVISGTPTENILQSKDYKFVIRATDSEGGVTDRTFSILLIAQELAPQWITPAGLISVANIDKFYTFQLQATDPDTDVIFYNLIAGVLPNGLLLNSSTGMILGTPFDTTGIYTFSIEVTDTILSDIRTFEIDLQPALANTPPSWITPAGALGELNENAPSSFVLQAADVDGDFVTFTLALIVGESFPSGLTLNSTGTITGIADPVAIDTTHTFTVNISDGINASVARTFSITIKNVTGLVPPIWITPAGSIGEMWEFYASTLKVEATDPNGLPLTFSIINGALPAGLSLNQTNGLITGFPDTVNINTTSTFTIRISNGYFDIDRDFSITILNLLGVPVTKIVADRITGYNRLKIANFVNNMFSINNNIDYLYREGDPSFAVPENFDMYLADGLPIFPPGSPASENPADEFYRIINDDPRPENTAALQINKNTDDNDPTNTLNKRHIGGHHYKTTLLFGDVKYASARDRFTGDILYDVIYIEIVDPQVGASFRPDLITYTTSSGVSVSTPDNMPDPGVAYPPEYPQPFQNDITSDSNIYPTYTHPAYNASYTGDVLNSRNFPTSVNDTANQAIPRNTESLDFITPNSLQNMRDHIIAGYGGFVDDTELLPFWMGSEQIINNPSSIIGWIPAVPIAYVLPNTAKTIIDSLIEEQKTTLKGQSFIIDRHLVYTTPILTPTTTFSDPEWPNGIDFIDAIDLSTFDLNTTIFDDDTTNFYGQILLTSFDSSTTTFDISNSPLVTINFDDTFGVATFDGIGLELYNKYIKFPDGDKYWDSTSNTVVNKLKKQLPAIDTE